MRCPDCGVVQKNEKEHQCRCGYQFILHAHSSQGMTDAKFLDVLQRAHQNGRFYCTFAQLYTAWCQYNAVENLARLRKKLIAFSVFWVIFVTNCTLLWGWAGGVLSLVLLIGPWLLLRKYRRQHPPELGQLKKLVKQWQVGHGGGDEMLLLRPSLEEPPAGFQEKEVVDYGVERIILVERPLLVDLLVKNAFHAEQNALIFSQDGYPSFIVRCARKILRENKSLPVYLLHDASEAGRGMCQRIKLSGRRVIDLGIRPEHIEKMQFLDALQLEKKGYKAPLDILPYPVLAALCGQAFREESTFSEVLEQWDTSRAQESLFCCTGRKKKKRGREEK
ncbi:MAG: hypothetical protein D3916_01180 [Candidatus Electrothrix sp. MAN1_4]|nr:hypothetical protein [Candidatus Electrothrix sp. MAN1_4]